MAVLFAWVLCTHAFDVPARRDVAYSLAGSAALMAVAAAQSVDLALGVYVVAWAGVRRLGAGGHVAVDVRHPRRPVADPGRGRRGRGGGGRAAGGRAAGPEGVHLAHLPLVVGRLLAGRQPEQPHRRVGRRCRPTPPAPPAASGSAASSGSPSPSTPASGPPWATRWSCGCGPPGPASGSARPTTPGTARAGCESAPTTGGQPGQAGHRVAVRHPARPRTSSRPAVAATTDVQTFYLAQSGPNLVFHADNAQRVYIQSRSLFLTGDGTIVSSASMGAGTIYTVVSDDTTATAEQLRDVHRPRPADRPRRRRPGPAQPSRYPNSPTPIPGWPPWPARSPPASAPGERRPHTYDKVEAIEAVDVRATSTTPPTSRRWPPGPTPSTSFLFGSRRGYCEQISTATVVMLRSLGIPAREAVGYVPGSYDPITDLYDVQAKDAHAWVQVWFPGYGWQNFDPTADVPLANPSPGSVLATTAGHALAHLPWIPIGMVAGRGGRGRRGPAAPAAAPAHLGPPDRRRPRAGRGPAGSPAADRRDPVGLRPTAGRRAVPATGRPLIAVTALVERYTYGGHRADGRPDRRRPGLHPAVPVGGGAPAQVTPAGRPTASGPRTGPVPRRTRPRRPAAAGRP